MERRVDIPPQARRPSGTAHSSLLASPLCPLHASTSSLAHAAHSRSVRTPLQVAARVLLEGSKAQAGRPPLPSGFLVLRVTLSPPGGLISPPTSHQLSCSFRTLSYLPLLLPPGAQKPRMSRDLLMAP